MQQTPSMNRNTIHKAITCTLLFLCFSTAQAQFELQGVIRPRFEYRDGYRVLRTDDTKPAAFISQRTRLQFDFINEKISTRIRLFDYRVWGDQEWKKDISSVGIHEAWAELNLSKTSKLKFGRQELKYDNSRLISPVNWNQIGAAHDALIYKFRKSGWELDLAIAWNQSSELISGNAYLIELSQYFYKNLNILWLSKKMDKLTLSILNIIDGYQDTTNVDKLNYRFTSGLIADYKLDKLQTTARAFYQGGTLKSGEKVSAYYLNSDISYAATNNIKALIGFELLSGNDGFDTLNTTSNAFDVLYGARHKFNGRMDYFLTPASTRGAGLINPYAKLEWKMAQSTVFLTEYHVFFLQNNLIYNGVIVDKFLGHEIDFSFTKSFEKYIHLSAGYSMMFATNSMEVLKGGSNDKLNHWAFVMININPVFFKSHE